MTLLAAGRFLDGSIRIRYFCAVCNSYGAWAETVQLAELEGDRHRRVEHGKAVA